MLSREGLCRCESLVVTRGASLGFPHAGPQPPPRGRSYRTDPSCLGSILLYSHCLAFTVPSGCFVNVERMTTAVPPSCVCRFSYQPSTSAGNCEMENSRKKQFVSFKSCAILSGVVESSAVLRCPARDVSRPFVPGLRAAGAPARWSLSSLSDRSDARRWQGACVEVTLTLLIMAPNHKSKDAGNPEMPNRSWKGLRFSGKVSTHRRNHSICGGRCYLWFQAPSGVLRLHPL